MSSPYKQSGYVVKYAGGLNIALAVEPVQERGSRKEGKECRNPSEKGRKKEGRKDKREWKSSGNSTTAVSVFRVWIRSK